MYNTSSWFKTLYPAATQFYYAVSQVIIIDIPHSRRDNKSTTRLKTYKYDVIRLTKKIF